MGGLAVRLNLTFESLEDLELALDALLERTQTDDGVVLRVRVLDGELRTVVGPFQSMRTELEQGGADALNLSRILGAVCASVEITDGEGAEWVEHTKRVETTKVGGGTRRTKCCCGVTTTRATSRRASS